MSYSERFMKYLEAYAAKDLPCVSAMFAEDISLRDWKISVRGKEQAVKETAKNFADAESIEIDVLHTYESSDGVAGELRIVVDGIELPMVTDVISFDIEGKIQSIRAYLGRED